MSRELKFRFWTPDKRMIEDHEGWVEGIGINYALECSASYGYIIMQYTGLKDWNVIEPKEVYESDIVRCYRDGMEVGNLDVIEFKNGSFCFRHRNMAIYEWENMSEEHEFSYHVIGNIYQNPELLTPKN